MANSILPVQIYQNFNNLVDNVVGKSTASAVDLSQVITVGQASQMYGYETTLNQLSVAMGRVLIAVRPYNSRFGLIEATPEEYGQLQRKISYYSGKFEKAEDWNDTNVLANLTLKDGASIDHYKIEKRYPLEIWFGGNKVIQKHYTRFRKQLKVAFSNAEDFTRFYQGEAVQINNEIQMMKEVENRALVCNFMAGLYYHAGTLSNYPKGMARNMTKEFNDKFGTEYTTDELLSTHLPEFTKFFASVLKYQSDMMAQATVLYHVTPTNRKDDANNSLTLWRHTPKADQRLMLASNVLYDMETMVYPEIFHDGYLKLNQYEAVPYWIDPSNPLSLNKIQVVNTLNISNGLSQDTKVTLTNPRFIGFMFDRWALATSYRQDDVITTPVNGAGDYYNTFYHWAKDYHNDFTENAVVFYMQDPA